MARRKKWEEPRGLLLVDKRLGWTSHDVISCVRPQLDLRSVGHTGTLDPAATGLLVLLTGTATKLAHYLVGCDKSYSAEITLGAVSDSGDTEGTITARDVAEPPGLRTIADLIQNAFTGTITQRPPIYSALKIDGEPAYRRVRRGQNVVLPPREVTIHDIRITGYQWPVLTLDCTVSGGTYIRSLARDIGDALGVGGYLSALRRTVVGRWHIEDAVDVKPLPDNALLPLTDALRGVLPMAELSKDAARFAARGGFLPPDAVTDSSGIVPDADDKAVIGMVDGEPYVILRRRDGMWRPKGLLDDPNRF